MSEPKDRIDLYFIPPNFAEEGTVLSGRLRTRNAVETAILVFFMLKPLTMLDTTLKIKIYIGVAVILPVMIVSLIGIQGESLTAFLMSFFRYIRQCRLLAPPDTGYRLERNRCEFPYKSRVMGTSEPLKPLKAPYMARNPVKWGFFRLKGQEIPLKI